MASNILERRRVGKEGVEVMAKDFRNFFCIRGDEVTFMNTSTNKRLRRKAKGDKTTAIGNQMFCV